MTITLEIINKCPSNLAHIISDKMFNLKLSWKMGHLRDQIFQAISLITLVPFDLDGPKRITHGAYRTAGIKLYLQLG